jgi:hypothetical protein
MKLFFTLLFLFYKQRQTYVTSLTECSPTRHQRANVLTQRNIIIEYGINIM